MNQQLNLKRLGYLARKDFYQFWRPTLIVSGIIIGFVIILHFIISAAGGMVSYGDYFHQLLLVWCIVAASNAFRELHDKSRNDDFLLLPASALEKTLVRLAGVSVGIPLVFTATMLIASVCAELLRLVVMKSPMAVFNPVSAKVGLDILRIIVVQSVFFLGAAWFKKRHLIKTALAQLVFLIILIVISSVMFRIVYSSIYFAPAMPVRPDLYYIYKQLATRWLSTRWLTNLTRIIFYGAIPLFCWTIAWLRVKECQSSDGI